VQASGSDLRHSAVSGRSRRAMAGEAPMPDIHKSEARTDGTVKLGSLGVFEGIEESTVSELVRRTQRRGLKKGEVLFNVGDASDSLYVVADGRIRIWTVSAAGSEVTLNVLMTGAVFGEVGMLDGSPRTAGASAMDPTSLLVISRGAFFHALDRDPKLAHNVIDLLCQRIRWTSARMEDATLRQSPQRLARILSHLAQEHGKSTAKGVFVQTKLTQGELAQWTAMSRENLNKLLNRWVRDGLLTQDKKGFVLHDIDALEDLAESEE
jgi:CRP/FNR family transcriptional regulator, cyclic AMP receptor protein